MAVTVLKHIKEAKRRAAPAHLKNAIRYVTNPKKTEDGLWVGGNVGTDPEEIFEAMMETKKDFAKLEGRQGYHFVISFSPGEADAETTFQIGGEFCRQYLGDAFDYVYAVHTDRHHSHCHIVFNSVNRIDGSKYRYVNGDWEKFIQPITDALCVKHDLEPLAYDRERKRGKSYAERRAELDGRVTGKDIIRFDIDYAISISGTYEEFLANMKNQGYRIREGYSEAKGMPFLTYYAPGLEKGRRDYNLGSGYRIADIRQRILHGDKTVTPPSGIPDRMTISNLWKRSEGTMQTYYVMRIFYAVYYHGAPSGIPDSLSVRKDLLEIEKLQEECNCLMKYHLSNTKQVKDALQDLKQEESMYKEAETADAEAVLSGLRRDKRILRRILKRESKEAFPVTRMQSGALQLPKQFQNILQMQEKGEDLTYGIIRDHVKSIR